MDNNSLEKYKKEMLEMYHKSTLKAQPVNVATAPVSQNMGSLIGIVTSVRSLYPVKGAQVTVFTGDYQNPAIIDTDLTDESGRTKTFILETPESALSLDSANTTLPYTLYNMSVEADGYIKNIHLNIPIFGTVTSLQESNLLLEETAGVDKGPQIFDEAQKYEL